LIPNKTYDYIAKLQVRLQKLAHFEYWPTLLIYIPLLPNLLLLFIRSGSLFAFRDANPGFRFKSRIRESKIDILNNIPSKWLPKTLFLEQSTKDGWKVQICSSFSFPLICKPELGERGEGVELIQDYQTLVNYLENAEGGLIVQEYIPYAIELGVFYIRIPGDKKGFISSIVRKDPMKVKGDGRSTLRELMQKDFRYHIQLFTENKNRKIRLDRVLSEGEDLILDPIANHSRGTRFVDYYEFLHPELEAVIGEIAAEIKGFYYGRFDIKIENLDSFKTKDGIKVIELNGIWSEPTHIYDARHSVLENYKTLLDHFNYAFVIAQKNRKKKLET